MDYRFRAVRGAADAVTRNEALEPRVFVEGVGDAVALVLNENRTVSIRNGRFVDSFPGYGVHRYKIELRSALH